MKLAVFGAGAIGCWIGGRLAAGGADVTLIGRPRVLDSLAGGLRVVELGGRAWTVTPTLATHVAAAAAGAELVIVAVKSAATADAGRALAAVLPAGAAVVSLQNGVHNVGVLRAALPGRHVIAGMVPFNVVRRTDGAFRQASAGTIAIEQVDAASPLSEACLRADLPFALRDDMAAVQWAKLVMNLNNAINALSGLPLAAELADRDFRRCLAAAQREALDLLAAAGTPVARLTRLPASWIARLLPAPDFVFHRLARRIVAIDASARSSMWDDLEAGRPTEVDFIQGEIVALAVRLGRDAPVNRTLAELVHAAEAGGRRDYRGGELRARLARPT